MLKATLFAVSMIALAGSALADTMPEIGHPAPGFTATDVDGKTVSLGNYIGKTVVLEWTNKDCPFVHKHYDSGNMQALQAKATANGVVWLTIISSAPGKEGYVNSEQAKDVMAAWHGSPTTEIIDASGMIGHEYGAKTTPTLVVIDPQGSVAYEGAIDDKPTADKADIPGAKNYLQAALDDLAAGRPVAEPVTTSYGCSVKYGE
jgi:peroxiredoxin